MRNVERGPRPLDEAGAPVTFADYRDAMPHLKQRLGRYCSFCERAIPVSLAVEHKLPKQHRPELATEWTNLLLACANCNSAKGARLLEEGTGLWPDLDDTFNPLTYLESGRVVPRQGMPAATARRAANLLNLVGLDRELFSSNSDHRWVDRLEVWRVATASRAQLAAHNTEAMRSHIIDFAAAKGGFSIWMAVFHDDAQMRHALCAKFPGTALRTTDAPASND